TLILKRELIRRAHDLKIVYTPLHGTGGVIVKPMLRKIGLNFSVVPEQDQFDGRFPTVKSPNPENAEALNLGISLAQKENADLVIATDPDCDRLGVAVRTSSGEMKLLSGNQIGSLLAWYRAKTFFELGIINKQNASRGVIIKTFVTTDLQKAIAEKFGLRCVETLTGFKYNGAKLKQYEELTDAPNYRELPEEETRRLRLEKSSFYIFGGEESYGYSGADFVRDKDGNAAVIMFCEVAAYAKSRGLRLNQLLDEVSASSVTSRKRTTRCISKARMARRRFAGCSFPTTKIHRTRCWTVRSRVSRISRRKSFATSTAMRFLKRI